MGRNVLRWGDLISVVSMRTGLSMELTKEVINTMIDVIFENVALGSDVYVKGLGKFSLGRSSMRRVVLPDGSEIQAGDHLLLKFKSVRNTHSKIIAKRGGKDVVPKDTQR